MPRELPLDLYDEIIDNLWDDKAALKACSVARRAMTVSSQRQLFQRIVLCGRPSLYDYRGPPRRLGPALSNFVQLLVQSPRIAGYVTCLQIINADEFNCKDVPELDSISLKAVANDGDEGPVYSEYPKASQDDAGNTSLLHYLDFVL